MTQRSSVLCVLAGSLALVACERHDVDVELPATGRALSGDERRELQRVADEAFRDVRANLEGLPPRLTLIVRWGKNVIPETGENGTASYPGNVAWTVDPDRDVLATIRTQLRPSLFHELHHLARASRVPTRTLTERVVTEGLAIAFERDFAKVNPPWAAVPPDAEALAWTSEILRQPEGADERTWLFQHPDGRRWIGYRVGTFLADRATHATGKSSAALVFASADEILRNAGVR